CPRKENISVSAPPPNSGMFQICGRTSAVTTSEPLGENRTELTMLACDSSFTALPSSDSQTVTRPSPLPVISRELSWVKATPYERVVNCLICFPVFGSQRTALY